MYTRGSRMNHETAMQLPKARRIKCPRRAARYRRELERNFWMG